MHDGVRDLPGPHPPLAPAWLEKVTGRRALHWVDQHNARTRQAFRGAAVEDLATQIEEILDRPDRIPAVADHNGMLYGLWTSAEHPRGLWRRTTWESYALGAPARADRTPPATQWEELLDLDALSLARGTDLSWNGAQVLSHGPRAGRRALVRLSEGGSDACTTQEYDLVARRFVDAQDNGFLLPRSKGTMSWGDDEGNYVLVGDSFTEAGLSRAGLPRQVRRLRRGQDPAGAEVLVTADKDAVAAFAARDPWGRTWVTTMPTFSTTRIWLVPEAGASQDEGPYRPSQASSWLDDGLEHLPPGALRLDVPETCSAGVGRDWLTIELREPWQVAGQTYAAGTLLGANLWAYLDGARELEVLFEPTPTCALASAVWTRHHLVLTVMDDVVNRLEVRTPPPSPCPPDQGTGPGRWGRHSIDLVGAADLPGQRSTDGDQLRPGRALLTVSVSAVDPSQSDYLWISATGWTTPSSLAVGRLRQDGELEGMSVVRQAPARYDARGIEVTQHLARSQDGTAVPYFQISRPDTSRSRAGATASQPTLVRTYGCFGHSLVPGYEPVLGKAWLERGGVYVVANTRGGGEYGPSWHQAAVRQGRHRVGEDLQAVIESLLAREVTTPSSITVYGSSAGALVAGDLLTRRPDLLGATVLEMPLLDLQRYSSLLAGASWISELGDPADPDQWRWMHDLSPLHQLREATSYPPVLLLTSTKDDRVHPWHARAMAFRLEELGQPVTFYEAAEGGHRGAITSAQTAWHTALTYTFAWRHTAGPDAPRGQA